jgi:hypothetical protein
VVNRVKRVTFCYRHCSSARTYRFNDGLGAQALEADRPRKRARAAGMFPAARALRSDVVRRAASRGGTLRCAGAHRVAYRDVDKSYASQRPR